MASTSTSSLRSRRSAAQLHALVAVEREIKANDHNSRRKYLQDFSQAFRCYESVLDSTEVQQSIFAIANPLAKLAIQPPPIQLKGVPHDR